MATTSTNFIGTLGAGSGIDIKALAQGLVDAEKAPKAQIIQKRIDQNQTRISGYSTVAYAVGQVKSALEALKSPSDFNTYTTASSLPNAVVARVTSSAVQGTHEVQVQQLAQAQRSVSDAFSSGQALNGAGNSSFDLNFTIAGVGQPAITVTTPTPEGVVSAINAANLDVKATLVNTGSGATPWRIVLQGQTGAANSFALTSTSSTPLGFSFTGAGSTTLPNRVAQDAQLTVNGMSVTRSTNQVGDVISGVTLDLLSSTAGSNSIVTIARDTAPVKDKIKALVGAYNDLQTILDAALDKDSKVEKLGASLVGDTTARSIRNMVKQIVMPDPPSGLSTNGAYSNLRQLGLFIDSDNQMKFASLRDTAAPGQSLLNVGDESVLDKALAERFTDVSNFFAGNSGIGIAKDMADRLAGTGAYVDSSVRPSSPIRLLGVMQANANERISSDKQRLSDLEDRMTKVLQKYTEQFSVMESLVGQSKSTRTGIENSFKGMSASR